MTSADDWSVGEWSKWKKKGGKEIPTYCASGDLEYQQHIRLYKLNTCTCALWGAT